MSENGHRPLQPDRNEPRELYCHACMVGEEHSPHRVPPRPQKNHQVRWGDVHPNSALERWAKGDRKRYREADERKNKFLRESHAYEASLWRSMR